MLEKQNRIIIVDNDRKQLEILGKSFLENGLGCRTFEYDLSYNDPLKKVRIAFFDINLTEKTVDASYIDHEDIVKNNSSVFNDLAFAINQYICEDNGPYVLVFWTANIKIVEAFKLYMRDPERGFSKTASPILIDSIDKTPFIQENGHQESLSDRILTLLNSHDKVKFLFDLEENARNAGDSILDRIYDILPKDDTWGESGKLFENLDKVLSKIGASTVGFDYAKENPKKAVYEGLLPILSHEFLNSKSDVEWDKIVNQLKSADDVKKLNTPDLNIQHKVNTLYHIEEYNDHSKDVRGSVIEIDKYSKDILDSFNIDDINEWMNKLLRIKDNKAEQKTDILDKSKLLAIELSASCDFTNRKSRLNKYILGVLLSNLDSKLENVLNIKAQPEASYHLGGCCFHYKKQNYHIWLNLNYVFGAKPDDKRLGETMFILKKEIMDMLGNRYANHVSRIGITSF